MEDMELYQNNKSNSKEMIDIEDIVDHNGQLINQQLAYDMLIHAEVMLHDQEHNPVKCTIKRRALDHRGCTAEEYHDNPLLNMIVYEIELADGQVREYSANVIAENILTQVNSDGYSTTLLKAIVYYKSDPATAVQKGDQYIVTR